MKRKYKDYPRKYEKIYTSEGCLKSFSIEEMDTDYEYGKHEYASAMQDLLRRTERNLFRDMLTYEWLQRRFIYKGVRKSSHLRQSMYIDSAYSAFVKHYLMNNYQTLTTNQFYGRIVSYIKDLYEDFDDINPIDNPKAVEYPFERMGITSMLLVSCMDERMDLLKKGEKEEMSYYEFLDFVINYINCVNEEEGKEVYKFSKDMSRRGLCIIKKNK